MCGDQLVERFKAEAMDWKQLEIAQQIVLANDKSVLPELEPLLKHSDRHIRGNAALVFGRLGDPRGLDVIAAILGDYSDRPAGQGSNCVMRGPGDSCGRNQIVADRYYAVHLLGLLKDPKAAPILVTYLDDPDINYKIPWALQNIGGKAAIAGLIKALRNSNAEVRVFAVEGLEDLRAVEAVAEIQRLADDKGVSSYGRQGYVDGGITVSEAARAAVATLGKP